MGNSEVKRRIWDVITANDSESFKIILKKYPDFVNVPISNDRKSNAVTRAAYLDRPHILAVLAGFGANLDLPAESGVTGLMWAAARNNIESLKILIQYKVNPELKGPHDMKAVDFAVLFGSYKTALYLYSNGSNPTKTCEEFLKIRELMKTPLIDFQSMLTSIQNGTPASQAPIFVAGLLPRPLHSQGSFRNSNETWGSSANIYTESELLTPDPTNRLLTPHKEPSPTSTLIKFSEELKEFDLD